METIARKDGFSQVCVWPGTLVEEQVDMFIDFMQTEFGVRVQYLEEVKTSPDYNDLGDPIAGTGGRNDLFFAVYKDDIGKFAVPRLQAGIRWVEDVMGSWNHSAALYPVRIKEYCSWVDNSLEEEVA